MLRFRVISLCAALVALVALLGVFSSPVHAKCDEIRWVLKNKFNPFTDSLDLIRVPVCYVDGKAVTRTTKAKRKGPTRRQLRRLRFDPSEAVSARVRERMIEDYVGDSQDPEAVQFRDEVASGKLMRLFNESVREQGWSTRDAGDVYALAYMQCWLGVNDERKLSDRVAEAVRDDLKRQLALDRSFGRAGDAAQQEQAEWIASNTVLLTAALGDALLNGDVEGAEQMRGQLRERASDADMFLTDLTKVRLTKRGIKRR